MICNFEQTSWYLIASGLLILKQRKKILAWLHSVKGKLQEVCKCYKLSVSSSTSVRGCTHCTRCGWDGMELILLPAAQTMLCFRSDTKAGLITEQCFSHCWTVLAQPQGLPCSSLCPPGGVGRRKRPRPGQLPPNDPRDFPSYWTSLSAVKLGVVVVCQNKPLLRGCLAISCWWEVVSDAFASIVWFLFLFSFAKLLLPQHTSFSCICPSDSLPQPDGGDLPCQLGSTRHTPLVPLERNNAQSTAFFSTANQSFGYSHYHTSELLHSTSFKFTRNP